MMNTMIDEMIKYIYDTMSYIIELFIKKFLGLENNLAQNKNSSSKNNISQPVSIIVEYEGNLYDISKFAKRHPGGKNILIEHNGKNVTNLMKETNHSDHAYKILNRYKIVK